MCPACMATAALLIGGATSAGTIAALALKVNRLKKSLKAANEKKVVRFRLVARAEPTAAAGR
jgi:hypothetical protein